MAEIKTIWTVEIETLSPLHIGSGGELLLGYDVVPKRGITYRVNEDALLQDKYEQAEAQGGEALQQLLLGRPAVELLEEGDYRRAELFRYRLPGTPFAITPGARVQEQIKDAFDRPYLPGSSLKGALRTILFWGIHTHEGTPPDLDKLGRNRSWAAQGLEREVFGRDPNHDWLRALQVADSQPLGVGEGLCLQTVRVHPTRTTYSPGLDVDVEAVATGVTMYTTITVDEYGFQGATARQLGWQGKRDWLLQLAALGREHATERLQHEQAFYDQRAPQAQSFYQTQQKQLEELGTNEFLVQLGWGAGWESKTLGSGLLRDDDVLFEHLLGQYRMTKERERRAGDPFPRTRMLTLKDHLPGVPLGWVRIKLLGYEPVEMQPTHAEQRPAPVTPPMPVVSARPKRPEDLQEGMLLEGWVRNIAHFGAFVDIGVGQDGLVHISEMAERRVVNVDEVVRVGQRIQVRVLGVRWDGNKWRIGLSMKGVDQGGLI